MYDFGKKKTTNNPTMSIKIIFFIYTILSQPINASQIKNSFRSFLFLRDLVDEVGTAIQGYDDHIYIPNLKQY